MQLPAEETIRG